MENVPVPNPVSCSVEGLGEWLLSSTPGAPRAVAGLLRPVGPNPGNALLGFHTLPLAPGWPPRCSWVHTKACLKQGPMERHHNSVTKIIPCCTTKSPDLARSGLTRNAARACNSFSSTSSSSMLSMSPYHALAFPHPIRLSRACPWMRKLPPSRIADLPWSVHASELQVFCCSALILRLPHFQREAIYTTMFLRVGQNTTNCSSSDGLTICLTGPFG